VELKNAYEEIESKNKDITDSINYAKRIQDAILPSQELVDRYFKNSFILYEPKDIIAGDFYWMEVIDNIVFIAAADCTGHGVPGAMVSVVCCNALNRSVKEFGLRDTGKILDKLTELVLETFEKGNSDVKDGMDISLLAIHFSPDGKVPVKLQWSGANNPLWYFENKEFKKIKADKQPIGKYDYRNPFTTNNIKYTEGSIFYLFTDGLPDQFGGTAGKKFMYKRFEENILAISNLPLKEQKEKLHNVFQVWKGNLEQVDDVTVIGIRL
jgi:serine phosphatase RsbU (regulator of sigma subunit)